MNYRKQGLRTLGLSLLTTLALMALAVTGAHASGKFLIAEPKNPNWLEETITGEVENSLESSLSILKLNHELICHKGSVTGKITSHGHGHVNFEMKNCFVQALSGGTLTGPKCGYSDIIIKSLALVILHSGTPYLLLTPLDGLTFAVVVIGETECAMPPQESLLKGCVVASMANPNEDAVTRLISTKGLLTLFGCKISYGAHEAHLNLDALLSLSGPEAGKKWGMV